MNMRISGTGSALPEGILSNADIETLVETSDEWIRERTGIAQRHISKGETVAQLGAAACENALQMSGTSAQEVDLIIAASCSPELALPCVACQIQERIGAVNAVCFDVNAACAGFLFALNTVHAYFTAGIYKRALVVGAEVLSKMTDWTDRGTCILFGDGAGAVLVEASASTPYHFVQHANGAMGSVLDCKIRDIQNPLFREEPSAKHIGMDGSAIFKFAARQVPKCIEEVLEQVGVSSEQIDFFLLHQANYRILEAIARRLGIGMDRFPSNVERVGNTSSASIPILLDECNRNGILKRGMKLILSGFGAGLTFGATYLEW